MELPVFPSAICSKSYISEPRFAGLSPRGGNEPRRNSAKAAGIAMLNPLQKTRLGRSASKARAKSLDVLKSTSGLRRRDGSKAAVDAQNAPAGTPVGLSLGNPWGPSLNLD